MYYPDDPGDGAGDDDDDGNGDGNGGGDDDDDGDGDGDGDDVGDWRPWRKSCDWALVWSGRLWLDDEQTVPAALLCNTFKATNIEIYFDLSIK